MVIGTFHQMSEFVKEDYYSGLTSVGRIYGGYEGMSFGRGLATKEGTLQVYFDFAEGSKREAGGLT
ncbi:MAG TPA: hypothetical protein VLE19_09140, partial [Pyrinomonadaceae bacterium]|nr:hypothetical protein [Pyrinomonadaceae bacterium]